MTTSPSDSSDLAEQMVEFKAHFPQRRWPTMPKPEKTFRLGRCTASVFVNKSNDKRQQSFRSVSLQRRYRDGDKWKSSTSFTLADLPAAATVLQLALQYVANKEATSGQ